jgi:small-conductance mechanosensitive channel
MWINDPHVGHLDLRSAVSVAILKAFAANGIQIPYPQRDVRIVSESVQRGNETTTQSP